MSRFVSLEIADVKKETADAVSVAFHVPAEYKEEFRFTQGQYITLKLNVNGQDLRRSYSICSGTGDGELRVAVKRVKDGRGSNYINDFYKPGVKVEVWPPMGNFHTPLNANQQKNYVLFAGGSGITPMLSIIKSVLKEEPKSTLTLFYGNRDEASVIFKKQIEEIVASNADKVKVFHVLEQPGAGADAFYTGLMSVEKDKALLQKHVNLNGENEYFICGPGPMMDNAKAALESLNIDRKKIHIEYFTPPVESPLVAAAAQTSGDSAVESQATVILDGDEYHVTVKPGQNVLEALLNKNIDAPYACQGGSCCTCRAKLVEGEVKMLVNYALLDDEVKDGFILTCQSIPLTEKIVVDYDRGK